MEIFELIMEVGAPVAGALVMGYFIFLILKQILGGLDQECWVVEPTIGEESH